MHIARLLRWWFQIRTTTVPWGHFGVLEDPCGDFADYRTRVSQYGKTLARVTRLRAVNTLRQARGNA